MMTQNCGLRRTRRAFPGYSQGVDCTPHTRMARARLVEFSAPSRPAVIGKSLLLVGLLVPPICISDLSFSDRCCIYVKPARTP
jgi:hypothetical protein